MFFLFVSPSLNLAFAQTLIDVNTTNDEINSDGDCSLREAIQAANINNVVDACPAGGEIDTINVPAGTYTLTIEGADEDYNQTGDLDVTAGTLTILGAGATNTIIRAGTIGGPEGNGIDRVFHVYDQNNVTLTINGVTIANGNNVEFGGGIKNGGQEYSFLTITNSIISGNSATYGGGVYNDPGMTLIISDSTIANNSALLGGGGIDSNPVLEGPTPVRVIITNTNISSNTAWYGGGIHCYTVIRNTIAVSNLTVVDSTFSDNIAHDGGGIYSNCNLTVNSSVFSDNSASEYGGGIQNYYGSLTLNNDVISGNSAFRGGGVHIVVSSGDLRPSLIMNAAIVNNYATDGGGLYFARSFNTTQTISNSTISGNSASAGSAIYDSTPGVSAVNSTIAYNIGGAISGGEVERNFRNTIIANTISGANCSGAYDDTQTVNNQNNIQFGGTQDGSCGPSMQNVDPLLGPLTDNGGFTLTHALLAGSPAIDNANPTYCPPTDQRGTVRPQGARCDIGAYERETTPVEALGGLIDLVETFNLQQGIENSLDVKIETAISALGDVNENNNQAAVNSLQAFINAVEAQRGNKITNEQANILIAIAQTIIDAL